LRLSPHGPVIGAAARMIISGRARPGARLNGMLSKLEPGVTGSIYAGAQCADHDDGPTVRQCGYSIWLVQGCMAAPRRELTEELPGRSKRSEHSGRRTSIQPSNALHSADPVDRGAQSDLICVPWLLGTRGPLAARNTSAGRARQAPHKYNYGARRVREGTPGRPPLPGRHGRGVPGMLVPGRW
jgi:hypothetical protein